MAWILLLLWGAGAGNGFADNGERPAVVEYSLGDELGGRYEFRLDQGRLTVRHLKKVEIGFHSWEASEPDLLLPILVEIGQQLYLLDVEPLLNNSEAVYFLPENAADVNVSVIPVDPEIAIAPKQINVVDDAFDADMSYAVARQTFLHTSITVEVDGERTALTPKLPLLQAGPVKADHHLEQRAVFTYQEGGMNAGSFVFSVEGNQLKAEHFDLHALDFRGGSLGKHQSADHAPVWVAVIDGESFLIQPDLFMEQKTIKFELPSEASVVELFMIGSVDDSEFEYEEPWATLQGRGETIHWQIDTLQLDPARRLAYLQQSVFGGDVPIRLLQPKPRSCQDAML